MHIRLLSISVLMASLAAGIFSLSAQAEVPYSQLEQLRRKSVVVRVLLDDPEGGLVNKCGRGQKWTGAGSALELEMANAAAEWSKLSISESDMRLLRSRVASCELRGSCQVYAAYLRYVKVGPALSVDLQSMQAELNSKLETLSSKTYRAAWKTVPNPCSTLKKLAHSLKH